MKNPCRKDCPGRSPTCHIDCEAYQEFFEERKRINQERQRMNAINYNNAIIERAVKCAIKARRR